MNFMAKFIATLIIIDTFLVSYALGFNSRHVLIEDPSIKAAPPAAVVKVDGAKSADSKTAVAKPSAALTGATKPVPKSAKIHKEQAKHDKAKNSAKTASPKTAKTAAKSPAKTPTKAPTSAPTKD